jgi:spore coat protein SA
MALSAALRSPAIVFSLCDQTDSLSDIDRSGFICDKAGDIVIYHLLPEREPFSAFSGLAIAGHVANVMRFDAEGIVVCESSDDSWGFGPERQLILPALRGYGRIRARRHLPLWLAGPLLRCIFRPLLSRLKDGDIVWCQSQRAFAAALAGPIHAKGAMLIYHAHNSLADRQSLSVFKAFTPDVCVFNSEAMRQEALQFLPELKSTYAIHNGADETLFYPAPPMESMNNPVPVVLFVGRLHPVKGVHVLLDAMRIMLDRKVNVVCKIIGSSHSGKSKPTSYVKSLLRSNPPNVQFAGFRIQTEIAEEYRAADIVCCPSVWQEPFGNVNIEAMACGVPVVASRVGGIPEIAAEGGVLLVEPNSPVELADALQSLIEDKDLRTKVGAQGLRSFRRRFTWAVAFRKYQEVADNVRQGQCVKA